MSVDKNGQNMHVKWTSEDEVSMCGEGLELLIPCINNSTQHTCDSTQQIAQQLDLSTRVKIVTEFGTDILGMVQVVPKDFRPG